MDNTASIYPNFVFGNILLGLALALILSRVAIWFARRTGLIDIPGVLPHKTHSHPIPLAGGITLLLTLLVGGFTFNISMLQEYWKILVPALIIFGVGLWDDYRRLPPGIKIIGQLAATILLIAMGTSVQIIPADFLGLPGKWYHVVNLLITGLWVVGITNAFNFIDSMDGVVVGIGGIAVSFFLLVTLNSPQVSLLRFLTLLIGGCIGLFFYNMTPARMFLGDSGAQTFGFLLAAIGIIYNPVQFPQGSSWFLPILILGVPIFDTCLVVFSRLRHKKYFYQAGHDHTYHRLFKLGMSSTHAVAVMHITTIVLGCLAFIALHLAPFFANILFGLILLVGFLVYLFLERKRNE